MSEFGDIITAVEYAAMILEEMTSLERTSFGFFKRCYEDLVDMAIDPTTAQYLYAEGMKELEADAEDPV